MRDLSERIDGILLDFSVVTLEADDQELSMRFSAPGTM